MKRILLTFFLLFSAFCYSQENCNNGIDDDGDGKIDLNDSDCICNKTASILANSSFEEKTSCPYNYNNLDPLLNWVRGTQPSPDYFNCQKPFILYDKKLENYPDGDGIIRAEYKNNSKEYIATKLQTTLIAGTKYQFKLNIATLTSFDISDRGNKEYDFDYLDPINITIFGCTNRDNLPLYTNSSPDTVDPTWIEIGHATYQPQSKWGELSIIFTPTININAIMFGAPSGKLPASFDTLESPSLLYDNLILNTAESFGVIISPTGSFCNGNLVLTANLSGNLPSSTTYQWYKDGIAINGATSKTYNVSSIASNIGVYSVKTTNGTDCFISSNLTINNSLPSPETIVEQPTCNKINGTITVKETGFNYSFDNGKSWQSSPIFTTSGPGKYYVKIKAASGCVSTPAIITIADPVLLDRPTFSTVQPTCNSNGSITITSPASEYSFDNGATWSTNATKNDLPAGNYLIKIKNSSGCESYSRTVFIFVPHLDYPTYTFTIPTCNSGGTITITTPASEYSFDDGATWTTNPTATDLAPGYYLIKIKNESGCESNSPLEYIYLKKFYVPFPKIKKVDPTCGTLGSITILTLADQYSFDNGVTWTKNPVAKNLTSEYYAIKTKNEIGCESETYFVHLNPYFLPPANFTIKKSTCNTTGSITITTPAFEYSFDRGETWTKNPTAIIPTVFADFYIITKNEFGCTSELQYAYSYPDNYFAETTYRIDKEITCDSGATITITSSGSEFSFDNGETWSPNPTATNLKSNDYQLIARSDDGCSTYQKRVSVYYPYLAFPTYSVMQPDCNNKGSITITTPAAFYSFDNGETWGTNPTKSNLEEGNYNIVTKNAAGCISWPFNVHIFSIYFEPPYVNITQPTDCGPNATGTLTVITPAAFYSFNDGTTWTTNPTATNLPVGSEYRVRIKNTNGCISEAVYLNFTPAQLSSAQFVSTDPTCDKGGSITITTQAPFYSFDGGETWGTNPTAINLPKGYYYPKIKNEFGCISPSYYSVNFNDPKFSYPSIRTIQPKCGFPGSIIVDTPAAQYSFDGGRTWSNSNKVLNIPASINTDNYEVIIKDETGCESYQAIVPIYAVYLDPPEYKTTKPTCQMGGSISIETIGAEYSFDNGLSWTTNPIATDLDEGNYFIIMKNALGCQSYPIAVYIPKFYLDEPLFTVTQPNCELLGTINVSTATSEYSIDNGKNWVSNSAFTDLKSGNYYLKIKNALGCESNAKYISLNDLNPAPQEPNIIVQQPSSCSSLQGVIVVSTYAYQYSFDDGITWTTNPNKAGLVPGTYFVKIKNSASGCPSASAKAIINPPSDAVSLPNYTVSQPLSCDNPFGTITITSLASKYSFDNGLTWKANPNSGNLTIGDYKIKIQNAAGCESEAVSIQIIAPLDFPSIPTFNTIEPNCSNSQGKITVLSIASEYSFDNGGTWTTNPASPFLNPGTYYIKIKNTKGCISEAIKATITPFISTVPLPEKPNTSIFCMLQNAKLSDITIIGQNIKWYDALTGGTILLNTTPLQNGITYYASQTINGCESERIPVTTTIQNTVAPTGHANQSFCTVQNATIANLEITGTSIKWYDALNNGSPLAETSSLISGKVYYASQTVNNCEGPRFGVTVSIVNTPSVPTANANQSFCKNEIATLNSIQISGQNIKWYDTMISASTLPNTTLLENNRTYYASQTIGCESDRIPVLVHVYYTAMPTGNNNQLFCIDENATIANLNITGTNIQWYDSATNGSALNQTTLLQNQTYYATQTLNNCESQRFAVTVKIQDTQNPIATSPQLFCIQQKAKISDIIISGQNIKWFESPVSTISLSESTLLENGITYFAMETINGCESERVPVKVNILEATEGNCINLVEELPFPKFFTPNGDGYNDFWTIDFAYLAPNTGIRIFDRYGKFIKELSKDTEWDGNYLGAQQPGSDYWFIVTRLNGQEFRGHFSLKR